MTERSHMEDQLKQELELATLRAQQGLDQLDSGDLDGARMTLECIRAETRAAVGHSDKTHADQRLLALEVHADIEACIKNGGTPDFCAVEAVRMAVERRAGQ